VFAKLNMSADPQGAAEFEHFLRAQMKSYEAVLKQGGIKFD